MDQLLARRYMNIDDLAVYLGVGKSTLYGMVAKRQIPFIQFGGKRTIKFDLRVIEKWMEKQLIPAKPNVPSI